MLTEGWSEGRNAYKMYTRVNNEKKERRIKDVIV